MLRQPLRNTRPTRAHISVTQAFPSPIGGWNARDSLAAMKPIEAVTMENWYPNTSYVEFRGGNSSHATGMTGNGKTLMTYNAMSGTNKFFCITTSNIFDVSSSGAVGASVLSRTNGKHQWKMFGDGSNNWLIACNGVDKPAYYDGTTWTAVDNATTPALTGVTSTTLIAPIVFKGRLMFIQANSLSFWYLSAGIAGGALTKFDLSAEFKRGGFLMAAENWTRDAGDGQDDVMVFVSSEGEAVIYQGTNPASATTWAKIGTFYIGKPIGRRCLAQLGGDLVVITENGTFPMSAALQSAVIDYKMALSFKIENAFTEAARSYSSVFGWKTTIFPARSAMIVNVPQAEDGTHEQYVMNTITQAWCKFTGWDAEDFGIFNGELYFTDGTAVYKAWTGTDDNDANIVFYAKQAFNNFKDMRLKKIQTFMPIVAVDGNVAYLVDVDVDFEDDDITGTATYTVTSGAKWDESQWDDILTSPPAYWASGLEVIRQTSSPSEWAGVWLAPKLKVTSNALTMQWMASQITYELGGTLI